MDQKKPSDAGIELEKTESRKMLEKWLNKNMRIKMTDGRILIGVFVCTDKDCNVILGSCHEYLKPPAEKEAESKEEPRVLGLAMVPGRHILSIDIDQSNKEQTAAIA